MNVLQEVVGLDSACHSGNRWEEPADASFGEMTRICAPDGGKDTPVDNRVAAACSPFRIGARRGRMADLFPDDTKEFGMTCSAQRASPVTAASW